MARQGQAEVVTAEPLGSILRKWCKEWVAERPISTYIGDRRAGWGARTENAAEYTPFAEAVYVMGPVQWLAEKTEIHIKRVGDICNGKLPHVPLTDADKLLAAIGRPDVIGIEIQPMRNPNWSLEKYVAYMAERGCI